MRRNRTRQTQSAEVIEPGPTTHRDNEASSPGGKATNTLQHNAAPRRIAHTITRLCAAHSTQHMDGTSDVARPSKANTRDTTTQGREGARNRKGGQRNWPDRMSTDVHGAIDSETGARRKSQGEISVVGRRSASLLASFRLTAVGLEPTPLRTGAWSQRLRPLGQTVMWSTLEDGRRLHRASS